MERVSWGRSNLLGDVLKVETRVFREGKLDEIKQLILIPTEEESKLIDFVFGGRVDIEQDNLIANVTGVVKLSSDVATHYIRLTRKPTAEENTVRDAKHAMQLMHNGRVTKKKTKKLPK